MTQKEILDLRYRAERNWSRLQQHQDIEHRTAGEIRSVYRGHGMDYDCLLYTSDAADDLLQV